MAAVLDQEVAEVPQHIQALGYANGIRIPRAKLKKRINWGLVDIRGIILDPPPEAIGMGIKELLMCQDRWGEVRASRFLARIPIGRSKPVGTLTVRQQLILFARLESPKPKGDPIRNIASPEQRMEALAKANDVRIWRKNIKLEIRQDPAVAHRVVLDLPEYAARMKVAVLLGALPGIGGAKSDTFFVRNQIPSDIKLGRLTQRQRNVLLRFLRGRRDQYERTTS